MSKAKSWIIAGVSAAILIPFIATNATIISFSAGGNGGGGGESGNAGGDDSLSVQIHTNGAKPIEEAWTEVVHRFRDETDIEVKTYKGTQINTQLKAQWDADNPPDFLFLDGNGLSDAAMVKDGKFLPLDDWYAEATMFGDENTPLKNVLNENLIPHYSDGRMYTLPILGGSTGAFYDASFMKSHDYAIPQNYEELLAVSEKIKSDGIAPLTYPGKYPSYLLWSYIMPAVAAYGDLSFFDEVCSAENPEVYQDQRFVDVLSRYREYASKGYLLNDTVNYSHTQAQRAWLQHRAAAIANGLWLEGEVKDSLDADPSFQMTYTDSPLVLSSQPQTAVITGKTVAIAAKAKHKENALKFASFLLRRDNQQLLCEAYSFLPALRGLDYEDFALSDCSKAALKTISTTENRVYLRNNWGTVGDIFNNVLNGLTDGSMTVDEGVERIIDEAKKQ